MYRKTFVLLFFYGLVVGNTGGIMFSQEKPSAAESNIVKQTSTIVAIAGDDEFYVGKEQVTETDIPEKIKQMLKDRPSDEQVVYVKAMCPVKYGVVVSVIDTLRDAGFNSIGLISEKETSTGKSNAQGTKPSAVQNKQLSNVAVAGYGDNSLLPTSMETILIEAGSNTLIRLNSKAMSLPRLKSALKQLLIGRSDKTVFIKAPKGMIYCDVLKVVGIAKEAGAQPIGLRVDNLK
jgi:biopolymer transport protein ExbD